ncbi:MAG: SdpI family protein [Chloroflexi bacterium]|nr:SdpI family protein [Chloroflexota bacterium]
MKIRSLVVAGSAILLAMLALSAWAWFQLPDGAQVPVHWGPNGEPDGWGPKWLGLLGLPATAAFVLGLLALIPRFEPRLANLSRSAPAYVAIGLAVMGMLAIMHVAAVMAALGSDIDMSAVALLAAGAMFIVIGNFMGKTRSNWFFGIRTPWTLSSERSWAKTHRLGGRLFMAMGVAVVAAVALIGSEAAVWVMLAALALVIVVLFVYSYIAWRDDPARIEAGRTGSAR